MNRPLPCWAVGIVILLLELATVPAQATNAELYGVSNLIEPLGGFFDRITKEIQDVPQNLPPVAVDPVVTSVREPIMETLDRVLGGSGLNLGYARFNSGFLSQAAAFWGFYASTRLPHGENWAHNFHFFIEKVDAVTVIVYYKKGKVLFFRKVGSTWEFRPFLFGLTYAGTRYQMVEAGTKLELMDPENQQILAFEFASLGNFQVAGVEKIRDRNGNAHTLTYNPNGTLALVEDDLGRSLSFQYLATSGGPRVSRVIDQSGRSHEYAYDGVGLVTSVTDANGGATQYTYDANRQLTSITEPEGNVVLRNTYDANFRAVTQTDGEGNLHTFAGGSGFTTITDPLGNTRTHFFDGQYRMTGFTDEAGGSIQYTYDANHRLTSTTDRMGDVSTITYHAPSGYPASRTDNLGNTWTYTYDAQMQEGFTFHVLVRIDYPDGTAATLTRDGLGNVTSFTDREGNTTSYTRNSSGQILAVTNAEGGVTSYTYNGDATVASRQDPSGNVTTYDYDAQKRLVAVHRPDASTLTYTYDGNDNLLSVTDENGNTTTYAYDGNDNLVAIIDPLGHQTGFGYDGNNDLVSVTDPLGQTTNYTYDGLRRVATRTDPSGNTVSYAYDARRRLDRITDELGQIWSFTYDSEGVLASLVDPLGQAYFVFSDGLGRITRIQDPLGNEIEYVYDALSRLLQVTDALGRTTTYERDGNGLLTQIALAEPGISASYARSGLLRIETVTDPRGNLWSSSYDNQARRTSRTDPLGNQFTYTYDGRNRLLQSALPGGVGSIDYTYDAASRLTQWSASDGTVFSYTYDDDDRLTATSGVALTYNDRDEITQCNGLDMTYDADGNLTSITYEPSKTVTYAYDARDQLTTVTDWTGGVTTFSYDSEGRLDAVAHPNEVVTSYTYDGADRLLGIAENDAQAALLSSIVLVRDGDGQIIQAIRNTPLQATPSQQSNSFEYDAANQDAGDTHDALGRLLDDGTRTYSWNLADDLTGYTQDAATVTFTRDASGNVLSRTGDGGTRELVWNYALGLASIAVEKEGGAPIRYHIYTPGGRLLYGMIAGGAAAGGDSRVIYHYDEVGSTIFLTDESGQIVQSYAYSPYGAVLAEVGSTENPFTFHGRYGVRQEGALYSMRARYFDPDRGRFISRDPIEQIGPRSVNPYQAFLGAPLLYMDPEGTDDEENEGTGRVQRFFKWVWSLFCDDAKAKREQHRKDRQEMDRRAQERYEAEVRKGNCPPPGTGEKERKCHCPPTQPVAESGHVWACPSYVSKLPPPTCGCFSHAHVPGCRFATDPGTSTWIPPVQPGNEDPTPGGASWSPSWDLRDPPPITMDDTFSPTTDAYVYMDDGIGNALRLEYGFLPVGPGNARDAEQDPDLSRSSFPLQSFPYLRTVR